MEGEVNKREQVKDVVIEKVKAKYTKEDGTVDIDGLLNEVWLKDEKAHFARREAEERRIKEGEYVTRLEERERLLKEKEEAELLEQNKFKELLEKKSGEVAEKDKRILELAEYQKKYSEYMERVKGEVEAKAAQLSAENKEVYELAAVGMGEDYDKRLALIAKLTGKVRTAAELPSGSVAQNFNADDPEMLYKLKATDPDLYQAKLRESILKKINVK